MSWHNLERPSHNNSIQLLATMKAQSTTTIRMEKPNQDHHNPSSPCTTRFHLPQTSLIWGLFHLWGSTRETSRRSVSIFSGLWSHTPRRHANQNVILATVAEPMKSWVRKIALAPRDFVYLEHYLSGAYFIFGGPQVMLVDGLCRFTALYHLPNRERTPRCTNSLRNVISFG